MSFLSQYASAEAKQAFCPIAYFATEKGLSAVQSADSSITQIAKQNTHVPIARTVPLHQKLTENFCASARRTWETQTEEHEVSKRWLQGTCTLPERPCLRLRHCAAQSNARF